MAAELIFLFIHIFLSTDPADNILLPLIRKFPLSIKQKKNVIHQSIKTDERTELFQNKKEIPTAHQISKGFCL